MGVPVPAEGEDAKDKSEVVREILLDRLFFTDADLDEFGPFQAVRPWSTWEEHPIEVTFQNHDIRDEVMMRMGHLKSAPLEATKLRLAAKYPRSWSVLVKRLEGKNKKIRTIKDNEQDGAEAFWAQIRYRMNKERLAIWLKKVGGDTGWMPARENLEVYGETYPELSEYLTI